MISKRKRIAYCLRDSFLVLILPLAMLLALPFFIHGIWAGSGASDSVTWKPW